MPATTDPQRTLHLRPLVDDDLGWCYRVASERTPEWLRVCGEGLPLPPRFGERIWRGVFAQFAVIDPAGEPVGVGALYDVSERHGTTWVDATPAPGEAADSVERLLVDGLLDHAFHRAGFRKAYLAYPQWRVPDLAPSWDARREALLEDHLRHDDTWWDVGVLAVDRPTPS